MGGGENQVNRDRVIEIACEQLHDLDASELWDNAASKFICVSGSTYDLLTIGQLISKPDFELIRNADGVGELPTMKRMQDWCKDNPGHNVLYFHAKGSIHASGSAYDSWRHCMQRACVWNWKQCVHDLEHGCESVGAHWLTPELMPFIGRTAYWGGNFWWATSDFLNTLPPIDINANRYEAEVWIGRGPRRPRVRDYAPHFPTNGCQ